MKNLQTLSAIDSIKSPVLVQAMHHELKTGSIQNEIIQYIVWGYDREDIIILNMRARYVNRIATVWNH